VFIFSRINQGFVSMTPAMDGWCRNQVAEGNLIGASLRSGRPVTKCRMHFIIE
jgi:hypothetical protein